MSVNLNYVNSDYGLGYMVYDPGKINGTTAQSASYNSTNTDSISYSQPEKTAEAPKEKKMGILEGIWHGIKGAGKSVVNTVKSIVKSPGKLLLTAGAVALAIVCPPAGVAMAVAGGVMGAYNVGKGIKNVVTAKTYEEQVAAAENIGAGALQVGLSIVGAKAGMKSMGVNGSLTKASTWGQFAKVSKADYFTTAKGNLGLSPEVVSRTTKLANVTKEAYNSYSSASGGKLVKSYKALEAGIKTTAKQTKTFGKEYTSFVRRSTPYLKAKAFTSASIKAGKSDVLPSFTLTMNRPNNGAANYQPIYILPQYAEA